MRLQLELDLGLITTWVEQSSNEPESWATREQLCSFTAFICIMANTTKFRRLIGVIYGKKKKGKRSYLVFMVTYTAAKERRMILYWNSSGESFIQLIVKRKRKSRKTIIWLKESNYTINNARDTSICHTLTTSLSHTCGIYTFIQKNKIEYSSCKEKWLLKSQKEVMWVFHM